MSNLRIEEGKYTHEIMRENDLTTGRLDARYKGTSLDPLAEFAEYDPLMPAVAPAFTAAFLHYIHNDLKFGKDMDYIVMSDKAYPNWDWKHNAPAKGEGQWLVNTVPDLAHAMIFNPDLKIIVLQGMYDLATPLLATEYMVSQLNIGKKLQSNISIKYYEAGHMMYLHKPALKKMKEAVAEFIGNTLSK